MGEEIRQRNYDKNRGNREVPAELKMSLDFPSMTEGIFVLFATETNVGFVIGQENTTGRVGECAGAFSYTIST